MLWSPSLTCIPGTPNHRPWAYAQFCYETQPPYRRKTRWLRCTARKLLFVMSLIKLEWVHIVCRVGEAGTCFGDWPAVCNLLSAPMSCLQSRLLPEPAPQAPAGEAPDPTSAECAPASSAEGSSVGDTRHLQQVGIQPSPCRLKKLLIVKLPKDQLLT